MYKIALVFAVMGLVACEGELLSDNEQDCSNDGVGCGEGFTCESTGLSGYQCVPQTEADAMVPDAIPPATCDDGLRNGDEADVDCGGAVKTRN